MVLYFLLLLLALATAQHNYISQGDFYGIENFTNSYIYVYPNPEILWYDMNNPSGPIELQHYVNFFATTALENFSTGPTRI